MKKLISTLLALALILALTGAATASCKFKTNDFAKFTKNSNCYEKPRANSKWTDPETIIRKGSVAMVIGTQGSWVAVQLTPAYQDSSYGNTCVEENGVKWYFWACWVKEDVLGPTKKTATDVTFSQGGVGMSKQLSKILDDTGSYVDRTSIVTVVKSIVDGKFRLSPDCYKHVKVKAKTWMHREPSLKKNYGKALHKGDKVSYRRKWAVDSRGIIFYSIKYKGKCLWVSEKYTRIVE